MRTFFSVSLSDNTQEQAHALLQKLRTDLEDVEGADSIRWMRSINLHLTLKFLGEIPMIELPALVACGRKAAKSMRPFGIKFSDFLRLGSRRRAKFCLGLKTSPNFQQLADRLEHNLSKEGFPARKREILKPHLTLARLKKTSPKIEKYVQSLTDEENVPDSMKVTGFDLMKSQLHPKGATYSVLERFEFEH